MKRLLIVMCALCLCISGFANAEESQTVENAQPVAQEQQAAEQPVVTEQAPEQQVVTEPAPQPPAQEPVAPEKQKAAPSEAKPVQAKPDVMSEIVVTATRTKQEARKTPSKVEVVKAEQLRDTNVMTADQSLQTLPGVNTDHRQSPIGLTDPRFGVTLRGLPQQSRTLVLLDGQKINNYEGNTFWWGIPPEAIERIEVVKGPFSSLYGGGAMGGVINIITKTEYVPLYFSMGVGSYDTTDMSIGSGARVGDFAYHIMYNKKTVGEIDKIHTARRFSDGMTTIATASGGEAYIDGYNTWLTTIDALELGFDWDLGSDSTLGFKAGNSTFVLDPQTNYNVVGDDITGNVRENASRHFNLSYETIFNKYADFKAHVGLVDNYQDLFMRNPSSGESTCPNSTYNGALQSNINLPFNNTLTVGMDASKGRMVSEDLSTGSLQSTKGTLLSAGAFVQDEFKAFDFLIFYAGARYDYWKAMDAKNNSAEGSNISDRTRNYVSPKGSIVILPDDKTTIRGTVGESFRAPVLNEMFTYRMKPSDGSTTMPNLRLKPETALTYEGNVERIFFDRLTLGASYFSIHLDDMIYKVTINTDGDSQNQNIAEAWSKGYELSIRCKVIDGVTLFANQTHTDTRISKDTRYDALERLEGKQFTSTPQDIYNYGCDVKYAGFFGNVQAKSVGDQYYEEDNSDIFDHSYGGYDRYTIVDATVGYKFLKNCSLAVSVSNIGDRKYWDGTDRNPGRTYMVKGTASF